MRSPVQAEQLESAPPTEPGVARRAGTAAAATSGAVGALVGLGAGHLAAAAASGARSPVVAVGNGVIDNAPLPVKEFAISVFGANDKVALVVGIGVLSVLFGALLGVLARRRTSLAVAGFAAFAAVGVLASLGGATSVLIAAAPSVVAGLAAAAATLALLRLAVRPAPAPAEHGGTGRAAATRSRPAHPDARPRADRRTFLAGAGGGLALAAVLAGSGAVLAQRFSAAASRIGLALPRPARALAPIPESVAVDVDGVAPFVTPNADFYRVDVALQVPQLRAEDWTLQVTGMVDRPISISYADLLGRPLAEFDITMTCVSNVVGGSLVGNARWLGLPVRDLLDEAGVHAGADQLVGRSSDGYTCGYPIAAAYDRDAILAVGMNGEPLPLEHGFPARLITPGIYGYVGATKWLVELEVTTFDAFDQYWVPRGYDALAPIKTSARIDTPKSLERVPFGPVAIGGVAWAQTRGIDRVELKIDDGEWQETTLAEQLNATTWRQWSYAWDATPGNHQLTVRATDGTGELQTEERAEIVPNGTSGWQSLFVVVDEAPA